MINIIKADIYRLFKSKVYKNCFIGAISVAIFILMYNLFIGGELWIMSFTGKDGIRRGFQIGLEQGADLNKLIINAISSGAGLYIIAIILTSTIMVSKIRSGVYKNEVAYGYERWKIYLAQLISLIIGVAILISMTYLSILFITALIFRGKVINYQGIVLIIKALILYIFIISMTVSIYLFLANLIANSDVIATIAIIEMFGLAMSGPFLLTKVNDFIPYSMIRTLAYMPESIDLKLYLFNGIIVILISTFLGVVTFNKKEIK